MRKTYLQIVQEKLTEMEVGDEFNFKEFVEHNWGHLDSFTVRSFDVFLCQAKKEIKGEFQRDSKNSTIKRIN